MTEILDLSKIGAPRDTVRLPSKAEPEGKAYDLVNPTDFGLLELQQLMALQVEADDLAKLKKRTPKQNLALDRTLAAAVKLLIPTVPPAVLKALPRAAREQIVITWVGRHYTGPGERTGEARSRRTTAGSSRGSKRSTAATRKTGSTSRSGR